MFCYTPALTTCFFRNDSCMSEAEKYQGALFQAKEKTNKGEQKQQRWLEVGMHICTCAVRAYSDTHVFALYLENKKERNN